jgi:ferredoxin/flavodoxin---NADP+ reductase
MKEKIQCKVLEVRDITESTYVLRIERNGFEFRAGQYLVLSVPDERKAREYSIYSAESDDFIELLIKEVQPGEMSHELKYLKVGTKVQISGPFGYFILKDEVLEKKQPVIFIASGTGISPFHSIILSNPSLDYRIIHGVRFKYEAYQKEDYNPLRYQLCSSRENGIGFKGRVTDFLKTEPVNTKALYYLCGNSAMVDEVSDYLEQNGLPVDQIKTEVFF